MHTSGTYTLVHYFQIFFHHFLFLRRLQNALHSFIISVDRLSRTKSARQECGKLKFTFISINWHLYVSYATVNIFSGMKLMDLFSFLLSLCLSCCENALNKLIKTRSTFIHVNRDGMKNSSKLH